MCDDPTADDSYRTDPNAERRNVNSASARLCRQRRGAAIPSAHNGFAHYPSCFGGGCRSRRESSVRTGCRRSRAAADQRAYRSGHQVSSGSAGGSGEFV